MKLIEHGRLGDAAYERGSWGLPSEIEPGRLRASWLMCLAVFAGACAAMISVWTSKGTGPDTATAQMEHMLGRLDEANGVTPAMAQVVQRTLDQPAYDCRRVECGAQLKAQNQAVRASLAKVLAAKSSAEDIEIAVVAPLPRAEGQRHR